MEVDLRIAIGTTLMIITGIAWLGQVITTINPLLAYRLGVAESEKDVDPVVYADSRGEAIWDSLILWILPTAALLYILQHDLWREFALIGSGSYIYFAGRGITTRLLLKKRGIRNGSPAQARLYNFFLLLWGICGLIFILLVLIM